MKAVVKGCVILFLDKLRLTVVSFVIKAATNERVFWTSTNQRLPFTTVKFKQKFLLSEIRNKFQPREFPSNFLKRNQPEIAKEDLGGHLETVGSETDHQWRDGIVKFLEFQGRFKN